MKFTFSMLLVILLSIQGVFGQNGYVITNSDSIVEGYLRYQRSFGGDHYEIELWRTKKDKNPLRFNLASLKEYAIKKDTFLIVRNFHPFTKKDLFIEQLELKVISRGPISLYSTKTLEPGSLDPGYGQILVETYILQGQDGKIIALDRTNLIGDLNKFLDFSSLSTQLTKRHFKYAHVPELIELYNKGVASN